MHVHDLVFSTPWSPKWHPCFIGDKYWVKWTFVLWVSVFLFNRVTFCGITMKNYVQANISLKSNTTVKYAMKMLSSSSETIIFMFLGVSTINDNHNANVTFIVITIFFCTFYRIIGKHFAIYIFMNFHALLRLWVVGC